MHLIVNDFSNFFMLPVGEFDRAFDQALYQRS
jgi:hypothetical protein